MLKIIYYYFIILTIILTGSLLIQFLLPFPYGMFVSVVFLVAVMFGLQYLVGKNGKPGPLARYLMNARNQNDTVSIKYVCLVCSMKHKKKECPRCGSTIMRTEFPSDEFQNN